MENWERKFEEMVTQAARGAFPLLCVGAVYLYYIPSSPTHYGQLVPVLDGQDEPSGAELATPERIPRNANHAGIHAFIHDVARYLEILPSDPNVR